MAYMKINGPCRLEGRVEISSGKNAVLPQMAAALLTDEPCFIEKAPRLSDVGTMVEILNKLGAKTKFEQDGLEICAENLSSAHAPYEYTHKMRASVLVMGPLLARLGRAEISLPGGCAIGTRPIDMHLKGFEKMGAEIRQSEGYISAKTGRLKGAKIYLDLPSVGATENLMMAATLAEGRTTIENAAKEPEISDLAMLLTAMGAKIGGHGTDSIVIDGVERLRGARHLPIPDRVEAATFMVAAAATGGDVSLCNVNPRHLSSVSAKLSQAGAEVFESKGGIRVKAGEGIRPVYLRTMQYPGFPTDVQAQMMALLCSAPGTSVVNETIFENRFMHVTELRRMGADINVQDRVAIIEGVPLLYGAKVNATDLRAGAAMVIAGLMAHGPTEINDPHHIERGYEDFSGKLRSIGADIRFSPSFEDTAPELPPKAAPL